ncbi:MAG: DMT family transporter [Gemmatimonadaceae bacterium]
MTRDRNALVTRPAALPVVLGAAVLGVSISGPLARLSAAEPLAIAVWRVALALVVVGAILATTGAWREWRALSRRDLGVALGAGFLLAIHFWSWIASLEYTSVAASVVLVNLHPVVVVAGSALWLGERPTRTQLVGIAIALVGAAIIGVADAGWPDAASPDAALPGAASVSALFGNALAVLGALTVGLYYLAGRSLRQRLTLWPYVGLVYGACLMSLLGFAAVQGTPLGGFPAREWAIFAGIALGPMLVGHTGMNWAVRYVPAYVVSLALLAEPVGAAVLAALIPAIGEIPSPGVIIGGAVVLAGLVLGVRTKAGAS